MQLQWLFHPSIDKLINSQFVLKMILSSPNHPVEVDKVTICTLTAFENPLHSTQTPIKCTLPVQYPLLQTNSANIYAHLARTPLLIATFAITKCLLTAPTFPPTLQMENQNWETKCSQPPTNIFYSCVQRRRRPTTTQKSVGLQASPLWDVAVCNGIHYTHSLASSRIKACLQLQCSTYLLAKITSCELRAQFRQLRSLTPFLTL